MGTVLATKELQMSERGIYPVPRDDSDERRKCWTSRINWISFVNKVKFTKEIGDMVSYDCIGGKL